MGSDGHLWTTIKGNLREHKGTVSQGNFLSLRIKQREFWGVRKFIWAGGADRGHAFSMLVERVIFV